MSAQSGRTPAPPPSRETERPRRVLRGPLIAILAALGVTLLMIDWTGTGDSRLPILPLPALLGLVGGVLALCDTGGTTAARIAWFLASVLWGLMLVPALFVIVLEVSGP